MEFDEETKLRPLGGPRYKGKDPLYNVVVDKANKKLYIGQRDQEAPTEASILLGKVAERVPATDYYDHSLWLDVKFPHVVFVAGKRGSGKSYDLGIILEGLSATRGNIAHRPDGFSSVLFDLQSQFWTLGDELGDEIKGDQAQLALLKKWGVTGAISAPLFFLPKGSPKITGNEIDLVIPPNTLELLDWLSLLETERFEPMGQLVANCIQITKLGNPNFEISDMNSTLVNSDSYPELQVFQQSSRDALAWRLSALDNVGLFCNGATPTDAMLNPNQTSVLLLRELAEDLKSIVVAVVMRQLEREMSRYQQRRKVALRAGEIIEANRPSRLWILIDEAHLVCPSSNATPANRVIIDYVKRGRDAGLSLVLATQQPSAIDTRAISQVDITILHKLTVDADIAAATHRLPAPLPKNMETRGKDISDPRLLIRELPPGQAILADAEASRSFLITLRPRLAPPWRRGAPAVTLAFDPLHQLTTIESIRFIGTTGDKYSDGPNFYLALLQQFVGHELRNSAQLVQITVETFDCKPSTARNSIEVATSLQLITPVTLGQTQHISTSIKGKNKTTGVKKFLINEFGRVANALRDHENWARESNCRLSLLRPMFESNGDYLLQAMVAIDTSSNKADAVTLFRELVRKMAIAKASETEIDIPGSRWSVYRQELVTRRNAICDLNENHKSGAKSLEQIQAERNKATQEALEQMRNKGKPAKLHANRTDDKNVVPKTFQHHFDRCRSWLVGLGLASSNKNGFYDLTIGGDLTLDYFKQRLTDPNCLRIPPNESTLADCFRLSRDQITDIWGTHIDDGFWEGVFLSNLNKGFYEPTDQEIYELFKWAFDRACVSQISEATISTIRNIMFLSWLWEGTPISSHNLDQILTGPDSIIRRHPNNFGYGKNRQGRLSYVFHK